jgi:ubiquinone/menaquinone biosynthesis C-methylase UbiE
MTDFVEDTYAKIAEAYADEFFEDTADLPVIDKFLSRLCTNSKVLDVGCGPGQFSQYLMQHGYIVEGIDTSEEMLDIARQKVPSGSFRKMDMRMLEYSDKSFDAVLAAYSLIHIPTSELPGVLHEIKRVLTDGGIVLFMAQQGEADKVLDEPLAKGEKIFVNFFSRERLNRLLVDAGFDVIEEGDIVQTNNDVLASTVLYAITQG